MKCTGNNYSVPQFFQIVIDTNHHISGAIWWFLELCRPAMGGFPACFTLHGYRYQSLRMQIFKVACLHGLLLGRRCDVSLSLINVPRLFLIYSSLFGVDCHYKGFL
jgi:hypothetical protein